MKKFLWIGLLSIFMILIGNAAAEGFTIAYQATDSADTAISPTLTGNETYLFLPSCASASELSLLTDAEDGLTVTADNGASLHFVSGEAWNLNALVKDVPEDGKYRLSFTDADGDVRAITFMFSANLHSLYIVSDDPQNAGRRWLEDCDDHSRSASGRVALLRADGSTVYDGTLSNIRGRGNSTWTMTDPNGSGDNKRAYQITLKQKTDLLDTGDAKEANKRWVLLADYFDPTLLHNWVTYSLAKELGLTETSGCTPVDLYYDGEYRGTYLLAEKVEVGTGRVDVTDYEKILEEINDKNGNILETQSQVDVENNDGTQLYATANVVDGNETNLGGYLIEMDNAHYQGSQGYFSLSNDLLFVVKNPKYASVHMLQYLISLFQEMDTALNNYGYNADTGKAWTDYFEADTMIPYYWIYELAKCNAAWGHSSYFVLPENGGKLRMGPVWDFDKAYYTKTLADGSTDDPTGIAEEEGDGWGYLLLRIPEFQTMAKAYFTDKLEPVVANILLGDENACGTYLHSLVWYWNQESASRAMNDVLWNPIGLYTAVVYPTYEENFESMCSFIRQRLTWLQNEIETWPESNETNTVEITLSAPYADVEDGLSAWLDDLHHNIALQTVSAAIVTEATETEYATWQADITLAPKLDIEIPQDLTVTVNGTAVPEDFNEDGTVTVSVFFEDPSYVSAEYDGTDYGIVFNAAYYAERYPEVVAEVGDSPEALLQDYVENGIAEGRAANAYFDPTEALARMEDIQVLLGDDYESVVVFFLEVGYEDWMDRMDKILTPAVRPAA